MEGWMTGVEIKVTPEDMVRKSSDAVNAINKVKTSFDELKELVDRTANYWIGEAGDLNRKMYTDMITEIDEMFARLDKHPRDLVDIANNYSQTEMKIEEVISSLPVDILA